ncbi:MAG: 1-acyl-sn-glycerol-3-phosphate acyltransferase [Leptolyngbyaceae cyanobacterium RU_5_1]|nr:1-acyl-sn-glycerol-3-phosphate acyltransferase [Leptolyngbyaceae cyanobacterium RU_5_1]
MLGCPKKRRSAPTPSRFSPWLLSLVYPLGRYVVFPFYFRRVEVIGRENLPLSGSVILAPTHRSRWDSVLIPYAAGHHITGRHLRYMVTADEMTGLQGWLIQRLGGFPVNTTRPAIASLRHGVELLERGEALVIFPEGDIFRQRHVQPLKPGLARLAIQAECSTQSGVNIVPISLSYSHSFVPWRCRVRILIGSPLPVSHYCNGSPKNSAKKLTSALQTAMEELAAQT